MTRNISRGSSSPAHISGRSRTAPSGVPLPARPDNETKRPLFGFFLDGAAALGAVDEDIGVVILLQLDRLAVVSGDPDELVVVAQRDHVVVRGPWRPGFVNFHQIVRSFVLPVERRDLLVADQYLLVGFEAIVISARAEEAIVAKIFIVIEQLPLDLLRLIRSSRERGNCQREKYKARFHT